MLDVIYDGQCGFCQRCVRFARALDTGGVVRFHDANARQQVLDRFPELQDADFENAMFVVTANRDVSRGYFAVRRIARAVVLMWVFLPLLYFPGTRWIGPRVYAWVARNRSRFGCDTEVCDPPHERRL